MNSLKRRQFLQVAGSALATISLHSCQTDPRPTPNRLRGAQPSTRKLALLVGINTYPPNSNITPYFYSWQRSTPTMLPLS